MPCRIHVGHGIVAYKGVTVESLDAGASIAIIRRNPAARARVIEAECVMDQSAVLLQRLVGEFLDRSILTHAVAIFDGAPLIEDIPRYRRALR